jgi:hypothetical protein
VGYVTVAEMRAEGVTDPPYDDPRVQVAIDLATLLIDKVTGWFFEPRNLVMLVDGRGHDTIYLAIPIIEITKLELGEYDVWDEVDLDDVEVYNRHLSNQTHPIDDRYNAKIVREQSIITPSDPDLEIFEYWPKGDQNIRVTGKFGFTDYDAGTPDGVTPELIKWACKKLAIKELPGMAEEEWDEEHVRSRIKTEKTRDQSITLAKPYTMKGGALGPGGVLTGDPTIDAVLSMFRRPIAARGV